MYFGIPIYRPSPCKDCADRQVGCHAKCEKYLAYRTELDAAREQRDKERISADVAYHSIYRNRSTLKKTDAGRRALAAR